MNEKITNSHEHNDDPIARKLNQIAEQTQPNGHFATELEQKLRSAHRPRTGWALTFNQVSPALGWVAVMIVLAIVLSWSIKTLIPAPQPADEGGTPVNPAIATGTPSIDETIDVSTPDPNRPGVDFRGAKLILSKDLPVSPVDAKVYTLFASKPATAEFATKLAAQFGLNGELYTAKRDYPVASGFMVTDGRQQLTVFAENDFVYVADLVKYERNYNGFEVDNAEATIRDYLSSRGFNTNFSFKGKYSFGGYSIQHTSPDGLTMQFDTLSAPAMRITLDEDGSIISITAVLMEYDPTPLGTYGVISADEALNILLDDTLAAGKVESGYSGASNIDYVAPPTWYHDFPENQTVTVVGSILVNPAVDASKPAAIILGSTLAIGNTNGMEKLGNYAFVSATGQFVVDNGVRKFNVESWDSTNSYTNVVGYARQQGDQILAVDGETGEEYPIVDAPADIPLNTSYPESTLMVNGAIMDGSVHWNIIQYFADSDQMGGGGGGGGGGLGFYQLNLDGPAIPFPSVTPVVEKYSAVELAGFLRHPVKNGETLAQIAELYNVSADEIMEANYLPDTNIWVSQQLVIPGVPGPTRLDGAQGIVQVQLFEKPNGTRRATYTFIGQDQSYYQLQGTNLEPLQALANRPIAIWGSIEIDKDANTSLQVEKFESLHPDLQFEVVSGTQEQKEVDGMLSVLFTTGGTTYIQVVPAGGYPDINYYEEAEEVNVEALRIPGETLAGYPTLRVYNLAPAKDPNTGQPMDLYRTTGELEVMPDPYGDADQYITPDMIVDDVELVYVSFHSYDTPDLPQTDGYVQPAWRFVGHYTNGGQFEILIQALKQEYLTP